MTPTEPLRYVTAGGVKVTRTNTAIDLETAIDPLVDALDTRCGVLLTSTYEYTGRYTRWDVGFIDPPLQITARAEHLAIIARNARGTVLIDALCEIADQWTSAGYATNVEISDDRIDVVIAPPATRFTEEQRSRQPSAFSVLRSVIGHLYSDDDTHLGLYGAFGYDLVFQFESIDKIKERNLDQRDLALFLPDDIIVVDHQRETALRYQYDFTWNNRTTEGLPYDPGSLSPFIAVDDIDPSCDHAAGEYEAVVEQAKDKFACGDLFEVVPSQVFTEPCDTAPSELFRRLRVRNPAPYGALMNLGDGEFLISASPEMYVRVDGRKVETAPIAGTIARGRDVLDDAAQILTLLNSRKDEAELTMCTDVDRNDKSRICDPGSIRVVGRRLVETYSRLFHTVDHVVGQLRDEFDGLDAFLTHMWAVTVTGAPKLWAMRFIEEHEKSPRAWYGGAIGWLNFNGNVTSGLTLRTIHLRDGVAQVRAGATLLTDSDPPAEERETRVKAAALIGALHDDLSVSSEQRADRPTGLGKRVLFVDHEDSFVHTLAGYFRRTGAHVTTVRVPIGGELPADLVVEVKPDLIVLSPGPGEPTDFNISAAVGIGVEQGVPIFGVCLGLQGIVEHFGGSLSTLGLPAHGTPSEVFAKGGRLFARVDQRFSAGRYHSLFAEPHTLPNELEVTATTEDGIIMAIEHRSLPISAVQFHPESMMTAKGEVGLRLIEDLMERLG